MAGINWRQVLAEVSVLLLGAYFAYLADKYFDLQKDRQLEQNALSAIRLDLKHTVDTFEWSNSFNATYRDKNIYFLKRLSDENSSITSDSLYILSQNTIWFGTYMLAMSSYYDLLNSGGLIVISNDEIRFKLNAFTSYYDNVMRHLIDEYKMFDSFTFIPYVVSHLDYAAYQNSNFLGIEFPKTLFHNNIESFYSIDYSNILVIMIKRQHEIIHHAEKMISLANEINALIDMEQSKEN